MGNVHGQPLRDMLGATKLENSKVQTPLKKIITFESSTPLFEAFYTLLGNNILSAPVRDSETREWLGFLDMRDLVSFIVLRHQKEKDVTERVQRLQTEQKDKMTMRRPRSIALKAIEERPSEAGDEEIRLQQGMSALSLQASGAGDEKDFIKYLITRRSSNSKSIAASNTTKKKSIVMLKYLCKRNPFCPVHKNRTLLDVAEVFCTGVHCVPVVDDNGDVVNIISQSFLSSFVYRYRSKEPFVASLSRELGRVGTTPVISVNASTSVAECLEILDSRHLTGMPILDDSGALVGNFSGTDLRYYLKAPTSDKLEIGALDYITKNRESRPRHAPGFGRPAVVSLTPGDTIGEAVSAIAEQKIHRVYIDSGKGTDAAGSEDDRFLSVLSIVDLIRILIDKPVDSAPHTRKNSEEDMGGDDYSARRFRSPVRSPGRGNHSAGTSRERDASLEPHSRDSSLERGNLASLHKPSL